MRINPKIFFLTSLLVISCASNIHETKFQKNDIVYSKEYGKVTVINNYGAKVGAKDSSYECAYLDSNENINYVKIPQRLLSRKK